MANAQLCPTLHRLTAFCLIIPLSLAAHLKSPAKHLGLAQYSGLNRALFLIHRIGPLSRFKLLIRFAPLSQSPFTKTAVVSSLTAGIGPRRGRKTLPPRLPIPTCALIPNREPDPLPLVSLWWSFAPRLRSSASSHRSYCLA